MAKPKQRLPEPMSGEGLVRCIACGYDLAGLPFPRQCPECGRTHSRDMLIVAGVAQRAGARSGWRTLCWVLSGAALLIGTQSIGLTIVFGSIIPIVILVAGIIGMITLILTRPADRAGKEWFAFDRDGFSRSPFWKKSDRNATETPAAVQTWNPAWTVRLDPVSSVWARLRIGVPLKSGKNRGEILDAGIRLPTKSISVYRQQLNDFIQPPAPANPDTTPDPLPDIPLEHSA